MKRWVTNLALALLLAGAAGCATLGSDPRDPFETFNRHMYTFNEGLDQDVLKPVATAYKEVVPGPVRTWVRNFFANLGDLWIGANNLLQGKPGDTVIDWARFAFNTTFGLLGINDVATEMGLEKHDEDFGQTLGRWGMEDGNYHVWPIFGSRTSRDTVGSVVDWFGDPVTYVDKGAIRWTRARRAPGQQSRRPSGCQPHPRRGGARQVRVPARRLPAAPAQPDLRRQSAARRARSAAGRGGVRACRFCGCTVLRGCGARCRSAAFRERADAGRASSRAPQPAATEAVEAAVRLLEAPAAVAPTSGG